MVLRCPNYFQALKWARLECKSYKISEPKTEPLSGLDQDELRYSCALPKRLRPLEADGMRKTVHISG